MRIDEAEVFFKDLKEICERNNIFREVPGPRYGVVTRAVFLGREEMFDHWYQEGKILFTCESYPHNNPGITPSHHKPGSPAFAAHRKARNAGLPLDCDKKGAPEASTWEQLAMDRGDRIVMLQSEMADVKTELREVQGERGRLRTTLFAYCGAIDKARKELTEVKESANPWLWAPAVKRAIGHLGRALLFSGGVTP